MGNGDFPGFSDKYGNMQIFGYSDINTCDTCDQQTKGDKCDHM